MLVSLCIYLINPWKILSNENWRGMKRSIDRYSFMLLSLRISYNLTVSDQWVASDSWHWHLDVIWHTHQFSLISVTTIFLPHKYVTLVTYFCRPCSWKPGNHDTGDANSYQCSESWQNYVNEIEDIGICSNVTLDGQYYELINPRKHNIC
jgi:hypothetical protein